MKLLFGVFVYMGLAITVLLAGQNSLYCLTCNNVRDPRQCTEYKKCHHGYQCYTSMNLINGEVLYSLSCESQYVCSQLSSLIGRRAFTPCSKCCYGIACNRYLCAPQVTSTTTATVTTTTTATTTSTTPTTTKQTPYPVTSTQGTHSSNTFLCIDLETSMVKCADLKSQGHCAIIPGTWYETAKLHCRKTCGYC